MNEKFFSGLGHHKIRELAEGWGTPLLIVHPGRIRENVSRIRGALDSTVEVRYAVKAGASPAILETLEPLDISLDVASRTEAEIALALGYVGSRLNYYAPGLTKEIFEFLNSYRISLSLDSPHQADLVASSAPVSTGISLRISPSLKLTDSDAAVIATGTNKLGMSAEEATATAVRLRKLGIPVSGLHAHIGSQVEVVEPYICLAEELAALAATIGGIDVLNLGGGMAVDYGVEGVNFPFDILGKVLQARVKSYDHFHWVIEPGRAIAAGGAVMVTRVLDTKSAGGKRFIILDARLNSLGIELPVTNCSQPAVKNINDTVLCGTACSHHDIIRQGDLPDCKVGDIFALGMVGAYVIQLEGYLHLRPKALELVISDQGDVMIYRTPPSSDQFLKLAL